MNYKELYNYLYEELEESLAREPTHDEVLYRILQIC